MKRIVSRGAPLGSILLLLFVQGCATVTATRVRSNDYATKGVRYYLGAPYLLVRAPVEVARTDELFRFNAGTGELAPVSLTESRAASTGSSDSTLTSLRGVTLATANPSSSAKPPDSGAAPSPPPPPPATPPKPGASAPKAGAGGQAPAAPPAPSSSTKPEAAPQAPPERPPPSSWVDAVAIVWLPDTCQQYALNQKTVLGKLESTAELVDGWRLSKLETKSDTTDLAGKVLDLVGTLAGFQKDIRVKELETKAPVPAPEEVAQAGAQRYLRKTTVKYLKPGLYRLLSRANDDCDKPAHFDLSGLQYEQGVLFTEFVLYESKGQP